MAKKKENTTSIGFEDAIWRAADKLRGNLNASEYEGVFFGPSVREGVIYSKEILSRKQIVPIIMK